MTYSKLLGWAWLSVFLGVALVGCSTAKTRVLPGEGGLNTAMAHDIERDDANIAAIDAANDYCKERGTSAVFESQENQYRGSMEEDTRNTIRKASEAAIIFGHGNSPVSQAGQVGHHMTSDRDYESKVSFRCK